MSAMSGTNLFEVGKTYRTIGTHDRLRVARHLGDGSGFIADSTHGGGSFVFHPDGVPAGDGRFACYELKPGAIDDEKPEAGLTLTLRAHERNIAQAHREIAGMAAKIEGMQVYIDGSDTRFEHLAERIDNLEKHCEAMQAKIERSQDQLTRHATQIANQREKLAFAESWHDDHEKRIDRNETELGMLKSWAISLGPMQAAGGPELFPDRKPTIKGGWINVYRDDESILGRVTSAPWASKEAADNYAANVSKLHRIACIRIPDFTEGEGL